MSQILRLRSATGAEPVVDARLPTVRAIDVHHMGQEQVICCWEVDGVLVDPGPQSTEHTLLEALGGERPRALLLTHIHFDHAGAAGSLVRRWPDLDVYVHERGAPHLVDPERLVKSAARLYGGEEGLKRLWGEVVPVPEANLRVLSGGETLLDGEFRVEYTPGHASHHVCYLHEASRRAFVGDMAGVRVAPADFTLAPTPPPDIDVEAWERSLETIAAWEPAWLGLTHFGAAEDAPRQLAAVREALHAQVAMLDGADEQAFVEALEERTRTGAGELAEPILQAAPPDQLFLGLKRWSDKHA
jgi:glyoxylase-like metal-dependent hydrolase (beta-lactamase superfamily II)